MAAPARRVSFYFDLACPFAFLASKRVQSVAVAAGAQLEWKPVLLGALYGATEAPQGKDGSASEAMAPAKRMLAGADLLREAERNGVAVERLPGSLRVRTLTALRLILAAAPKHQAALTHALFDAYWLNSADLSDETTLNRLCRPFGVDISAAEAASVKDELRSNTEEALERGVFGVPSFYVSSSRGEALFWGQDRLHFVYSALTGDYGTDVGITRCTSLATRRAPARAPRKLRFFHDFASPWSYIASTQVQRIAKRAGAEVEYVPILLGALFKAVGTPTVPMMTMPAAKRDYAAQDMLDWRRWWGNGDETALPLVWPDAFPLNTVKALRVAICAPETTDALYRAAWADDIDIGDASKLVGVLSAAGFDGEALVEKTSDVEVKALLRRNTEEAVQLGACGVPSFAVDDCPMLIWGQDRWHVVEDLLAGWRPGASAAAGRAKL